VERVEVVQLLAVGGEHDLTAGHVRDGERGTASGVAVELGEHHAVDADAVAEGLGGVDSVLTNHRVDDEQDLVRRDGVADVRGLLHHLDVDAEAAGGVDDDDVVDLRLRVVDGVLGDLDGVTHTVARLRGIHRHARALGDDRELIHGVGALEVAGDEQGRVPLALEPEAQLSGEGGLTGALETGEHDHGRGVLGEAQAAGLAAQNGDQLIVDDLDELLRGIQRLRDLNTERPLLHVRDEGPGDREGDIRLQQGDTDLACCGVDVRFAEAALAPQGLEGIRKAVGEGIEHGGRGSSGVGGRRTVVSPGYLSAQ
jgi:hypothetical protein